MTSIQVRRVGVADLRPVWAMIEADDLRPQTDGTWYAAFDRDQIVAAAHLVEVRGDGLFDDLWVRPDRRRQGIGALLVHDMQRRRSSLWLIADPEGVPYYERFGFRRDTLPSAIATRYTRLGLWPGHLGHDHVAMRWRASGR